MLLPLFLRSSLIGDESYFFLRIAEQLHQGKWYDSLSYGGRENTYVMGWPWLLSLFGKFMDLVLATKILLFFFGLGSFTLLYFILRALKIRDSYQWLGLFFFALSPSFLYLFSVSSVHAILFFLSLLGFLFYLKEKYWVSVLIFAVFPFFDLFAGLIPLFILFAYHVLERKKLRNFFIAVSGFLAVTLLATLQRVMTLGLPVMIEKIQVQQNFLTDIGHPYGFGTFAFVLSLFGFVYLWRVYKKILFLFSLVFLFVMGLYFPWVFFYFNLFVAFLMAYGIFKLWNRDWESKLIQRFAVFILITGVILSSVYYYAQIRAMEPRDAQIQAMAYLKKVSDPQTSVFSHYSKGFWINALAERKNIMDSHFAYAPDVQRRYNWSQTFIESTKLEESSEFRETYPFAYIYIDGTLRKKLWKEDDDGLLYLLQYSKQFKRVFKNGDVELWRIKRDGE